MRFAVEDDAHLPSLRLLRRPEPCGVAVAVDTEYVEPIGVAVRTVRDRHAAVIIGTAPPRAGDCSEDVMMMRLSRVSAAEVVVLGRVGVARNADVRAVAEKFEQRGAIRRAGRWTFRIEVGAQWNVHGGYDQPIRGSLSQHVGNEGQLPLAEAALYLPLPR
jgi:hypothetical protein